MKSKIALAAIVAFSMVSGTAFAENGCPIGYDRIELVNPNQILVHGQYGNYYMRTVSNNDLCDNIRLYGSNQCCIQREYQQTRETSSGGGINIDHKTANALVAVAAIGIAAVLIHEHHKKVAAEKVAAAEKQAAAQKQIAVEQSPIQIASANQPEDFVLDGVTYTKYHQ